MTGKKEEFIPLEEGKVKIYACGITVYDLSHIGHARQAIVYAMIANYFRYKGYEVKYVRNYTDVDDKIIKRANELGKDALEFSKEQIIETEKDMKNLHVTDADIKTKASEYIEKMIEVIQKLIEKGHAYVTDKGDVYFSVKSFKEYGKLSHRKVEELFNGVRIEVDEEKKEPADFALWKSTKPDEIYWNSPWGKGRPGWHIECSTMAIDTLGDTIDIHGGGRDLQFPHHENEIAQSESLTGKKFANYWTHCGLIKINGEKMSKSLGNSLTIREALNEYNYEVIKFVMLSKHYTSDIDISKNDFLLAESQLQYFYTTMKEMQEFVEKNKGNDTAEILNEDIPNNITTEFIKAMDDDFNTPVVIANMHTIFKYANNLMKCKDSTKQQINANTIALILEKIRENYAIIGLLEQNPEEFISNLKEKYLKLLNVDKKYIEEKIKERAESKIRKDFAIADAIRTELEGKGITLKDLKDKTEWTVKIPFNAEY